MVGPALQRNISLQQVILEYKWQMNFYETEGQQPRLGWLAQATGLCRRHDLLLLADQYRATCNGGQSPYEL